MTSPSRPTPQDPELDARAIRTLARTVYRRMRAAGYSGEQVVDFASSMLDLVREHWRDYPPSGET